MKDQPKRDSNIHKDDNPSNSPLHTGVASLHKNLKNSPGLLFNAEMYLKINITVSFKNMLSFAEVPRLKYAKYI